MTKLAKDFPNDVKYSDDVDEHFTIKSQILIKEWTHVPIFVFFKKADNLGVNTELKYMCDLLLDKSSYSSVFFEATMDISTLVKGSIKIAKVSYETFECDEELCNLSYGHCIKILDRLFYYLN